MKRFSLLSIFFVLYVCISAELINLKPGTYDDIPAKPGDEILFFPGVYTLPSELKLVKNVTYWGNGSVIKNSQSWAGTSGNIIYGFIFPDGTSINFDNNDTQIQITGNTFYSTINASSSAIVNTFSANLVVISNNTFYGLNEEQLGVSIAQGTDFVIANNTFYSSSIEFQIYSTEYNVNLYKTGVNIVGNCFFNVSGQAVLVFIGIPGSQFSVNLSNNTIYSYHTRLPQFTRAFNIQLQDQSFVVQGNYLSPAEASGALCDFCTPIVIQTSAVQQNSTISWNTIGGNAWSYYVQCFADGNVVVPVENNWFYGNVTPPISVPCGNLPNTIRPRGEVPPPPSCW